MCVCMYVHVCMYIFFANRPLTQEELVERRERARRRHLLEKAEGEETGSTNLQGGMYMYVSHL